MPLPSGRSGLGFFQEPLKFLCNLVVTFLIEIGELWRVRDRILLRGLAPIQFRRVRLCALFILNTALTEHWVVQLPAGNGGRTPWDGVYHSHFIVLVHSHRFLLYHVSPR